MPGPVTILTYITYTGWEPLSEPNLYSKPSAITVVMKSWTGYLFCICKTVHNNYLPRLV